MEISQAEHISVQKIKVESKKKQPSKRKNRNADLDAMKEDGLEYVNLLNKKRLKLNHGQEYE